MSKVLEMVLKNAGFVKRGSEFFRVHGDGTLQVLKCDKRNGWYIGLFSMYSELQPQWFTSLGCIPRYSINELADPQQLSPASQTELLVDRCLPWLEALDTHRKMLDGLFLLETSHGGEIRWVDELKIAPFLLCRDYVAAEKVIFSILENHRVARYMNKALYPYTDDYQKYVVRRASDDAKLLLLAEMIQQRDEQKIHMYLSENWLRNSSYARFCTPKN